MSDSGKAVFLSYASQDAEAARRIAEALRAADIEVWFDQSELRGGDSWDAAIRKQIKECALFVPIISANTQSRHEGYFRIEWELAAQRAMGIASGVAFILPVVIDDTREPDALVPDRFRAVQWTRLPGGVVSPDVQARFLKLWSHRTGVLKHDAVSGGRRTEDGGRRTEDGERRTEGRTDQNQSRKRNPAVLVSAMLALLAIVALAFWRPWKSSDSDLLARPELAEGAARLSPALSPSNGLPATSPPSEARQLAEKAWWLARHSHNEGQGMQGAVEMGERALQLDKLDGEVWALAARVDLQSYIMNFDTGEVRQEQIRTKVSRARSLAPQSINGRIAEAQMLARLDGTPAAFAEADRILRELIAEPLPEEERLEALGTQGSVLNVQGRFLDAARTFENAGEGWMNSAVWAYLNAGKLPEALASAERLRARRADEGWQMTAVVQLAAGDLAAARHALDQVSITGQKEEVHVSLRVWIAFLSRDWERALAGMRQLPGEFVENGFFDGPRRLHTGWAHHYAGRPEAARVEWLAALRIVEQRIAADPAAKSNLRSLWTLQTMLGRTAEAGQTERLMLQIGIRKGAWFHAMKKDPEATLEAAASQLSPEKRNHFSHTILRYDADFDFIRDDPRFQKLLRETLLPGAKPFPDQPATTPSPLASSPLPAPAAPAADAKSIAVLPFANLSPDPENAFFCDGVHEDVLTNLAKIRAMRVISRTSVMGFRGTSKPLREIAGELGVARILEGSVRRSGNRVRITAQLIDVATDEHLWAETFDRTLDDVFAIQSEISEQIASALHATLTSDERTLIGRRPTENQQAYDLFLQGRAEAGRYVDRIAKLEQAVDLDPGFVDALAWISIWSGRAYWEEAEPGRAAHHRDRALGALAAAERIAATLPLVRAARADVHYRIERNFGRAWEEMRAIERESPNDAELTQSLAYTARRLGKWPEALAYFERSRHLDPFNRGNRFGFHIQTLLLLRRIDEARALSAEWETRIGVKSRAAWLRWSLDPVSLYGDDSLEGELASIENNVSVPGARPIWELQLQVAQLRHEWERAETLLSEHASENLPETEFVRPVALVRAEIACLTGETARAAEFAGPAIAFYRDRPWPPRYEAWAQLGIAQAEAWSGHGDAAVRRATDALAKMRREDAFDTALNLPKVGRILIAAGRREDAITLLREMMSAACNLTPAQVRRDPFWSRLADDPRFDEILRSAKPL